MVSLSSVCLVMYSAAAPVISTAPFVPLLEVTLVELASKRCHEESSDDYQEMLTTFEELWAVVSVRPSIRQRLWLLLHPCHLLLPWPQVRLFLQLLVGLQLHPGIRHLPGQPLLPSHHLVGLCPFVRSGQTLHF